VSLKYLLDTNVVSEPLRPKPQHGVIRKLTRHEDEIAIPSVVWHELVFGACRLPPSQRRDVIEQYLDDVVIASMPILNYDRSAAEWHARERARLAAAGQTPPFVDGQIAAIAFANSLTLVTFNEADFRRFQEIDVITWR
jgi:tRNA(fMet)-specific endonuclease VapC